MQGPMKVSKWLPLKFEFQPIADFIHVYIPKEI